MHLAQALVHPPLKVKQLKKRISIMNKLLSLLFIFCFSLATQVTATTNKESKGKIKKKNELAENQYYYAVMHENGEGVEKNLEEAFGWYKLAAEKGHADAQYRLGLMYYNGREVKRNYPATIRSYQLSAEQSLPEAGYDSVSMNHFEIGIERDYHKALKWFKLAAEQNHTQAKLTLEHMIEQGIGIDEISKKEFNENTCRHLFVK